MSKYFKTEKGQQLYKKIIIGLSIITLCIYVVWRIFFSLPFTYGVPVLICGIIMLLCEIVSAMETILHLISSSYRKEPLLPVIPEEWFPTIDVFIATHNEPIDVLYKTANGCIHMIYPDKNKVKIWFCDDGNRESVHQLANQLGIGYLGLADNKLAKAGNLNHALSKTNGELIVTFDADMIPTRKFLIKTVPYFFLPKMKRDENGCWTPLKPNEIDPQYKIGFIQTPQSFYNPDLFQYNLYSENRIPNEQDYFFREINISRNAANAPIYAGSNTVISREALELVGGITTGTITEDFETGIHIQENGYTCYATSEPLAHGLAPDTIDSLIKQRERWGRGCIFSLRRIKIWRNKKLSLKAKFSYYSCKLYWWSYLRRCVFILAPILFILFHVPVIVCKPWQMFAIWLPSYMMSYWAARTVSSEIRTARWSNVIDTILCPYLVIPIILEALGIRKMEFQVTEKRRTVKSETNIIMAVPHLILCVLSVVAIFNGIGQMINYESVGPAIILFWLCMNFYSLSMAVFFMLGRKNNRMAERYEVTASVMLNLGEKIYGETADVSESGISILLDKPMDIPISKDIPMQIRTSHYEARLTARIVHVEPSGDEWKYCFEIVEINKDDIGKYYQLVYDRRPSLPDRLDNNCSVFEDFRVNLEEHRGNKEIPQRRRTLRILINNYMWTNEQKKVFVINFNYRYFLLKLDFPIRKQFILYPNNDNEDVGFQLIFKKAIADDLYLYYIQNHNEIAFDDKFLRLVDNWLEMNRFSLEG